MFNIKKKHWNDRVCGFVMFSKEDNNLIVFLETERMRAEERERIRIARLNPVKLRNEPSSPFS